MGKLFYYLNEQNSKPFIENSQNKFGLISGEEYGYIVSGGNQYSPSYTQVKNQIKQQIDTLKDEINETISNIDTSLNTKSLFDTFSITELPELEVNEN